MSHQLPFVHTRTEVEALYNNLRSCKWSVCKLC